MSAIDMLVVGVPVLDLQYPPSSPAVIKGCLIDAGYTAHTADFNILLRDLVKDKNLEWWQEQYEFESPYLGPPTAETNAQFLFKNSTIANEWIDQCMTVIEQHNPRWFGISVFSYKSHKSALVLALEVRKRFPNIKIALGGRGASSYFLGPDHPQVKLKLKERFGHYPAFKTFGPLLLAYGFVDHVIEGDGEAAVISLLSGMSGDNLVMGRIQDIDIESVPFVDYDDYDLSKYEYINGEPLLAITGSKGCVRKCTFCDIPVLWSKYKFRSGDHIAKEMMHLNAEHDVKKFYLTDSLVNGSLTAFTDFIKTLSEHNNQNDEKITWVGQYITKRASKRQEDDYYKMLKDSGAEGLTIGVESGSDNVRNHMKKNFSTYDIDTELAYFDKYKITCVLLFFSCYPTETWDDFTETVDMFIRYHKYCASGTVYKMTLGIPYTHHPDTPLWNMQDDIGLTRAPGSDILWLLEDNQGLTFYERIRRRLILQEVSVALRLPMSRNAPEINQILNTYKLHIESIAEFFGPKPEIPVYDDIYNRTPYDTLLMPPEIQQQVHEHLNINEHLIEPVLKLHTGLNDDISFDSELYTELKEALINGIDTTA
jgi:radical SAM superfamily enzyme YgiQ (UPF0313 family)